MTRIAQAIVDTGTFSHPYPFPTGPTAHQAPVYPFLLSFVFRLPASSRGAVQASLNILFGSILCAAVFATGLALGVRRSTALATAVILAVIPPSLAVELCNDADATLIGALAACIVGATAAWFHGSKHYVALGLGWGGVLLAAPALAIFYVGCLLLAVTKPELRNKVPAVLILTGVILAPWMLRNRLLLGSWFFIRDNIGLELRVSNADDALADPVLNSQRGAMQTYHPFFNQTVAEEVRREGEPVVYARAGRDAVQWIRSHPARFLTLTCQRFVNFWFPPAFRLRMIWRVGSVALAAVGLVLLWRRERISTIVLILLFALYPLTYYLVQSFERYRFPIEWAIVLLAVHAVREVVPRIYIQDAISRSARA